MNGPIPEVVRANASGSSRRETLCPQPIGEPGHVAIAVEGVGDQIEGLQANEGVERPRGNAADLVGVQREGLQVD